MYIMKALIGLCIFLILYILVITSISPKPALATPVKNSYFINLDTVKLIYCSVNGHIVVGSGVVIGKNRIITANHVVYDSDACMIEQKEVKIVKQYPEIDFAVLSMDLGDEVPITPISCDGFVVGDTYFSIGYSYGTDFAMTKLKNTNNLMDFPKTQQYPFYSHGLNLLNGLAFEGMSGGPIINMDGQIVGITNMSNQGSMVGSRSLSETPLCSALVNDKSKVP